MVLSDNMAKDIFDPFQIFMETGGEPRKKKSRYATAYESGKPVYKIIAHKYHYNRDGFVRDVTNVEIKSTTLSGVRSQYRSKSKNLGFGEVWVTYHRDSGKKDKRIGIVNVNRKGQAYFQNWAIFMDHNTHPNLINKDGSLGKRIDMFN